MIQVESVLEVFAKRDTLRGYELAWAPPQLRHFTCKFERL